MIAPVLPGFGKSRALARRTFDLEDYAEWCGDLLQTLDVDGPVVVLGESMGGALAVMLGAREPKVAHSLALFNSAGGYLPGRNRIDWMLGVARLSLPRKGALGQWISSIADALLVLRRPRTAWRLAGLVVNADLRPVLERLANLAVPVVAVFSRRDPVVLAASGAAFRDELNIETLFVEGDHRSFLEGHPAIELIVENLLESACKGEPLEHDPARRIGNELRERTGLSLSVEPTGRETAGPESGS